RIVRDLSTVAAASQADGGFSPVLSRGEELSRTYSTVIALWALIEARDTPALASPLGKAYDETIRKGVTWMFTRGFRFDAAGTERPLRGWVANPWRANPQEVAPGLNAQALWVVSRIVQHQDFNYLRHTNYARAVDSFLDGQDFERSDIDKN